MNKKFLTIATAVVLLAAGCNKVEPVAPRMLPDALPHTEVAPVENTKPVTPPSSQDTVISKNPETSQTVEYKGAAGKTALELLKAKYPVKTKTYSYGDFVEAINNIMPDKNHFWSFYINGKLSNVGAGTYVTKDADTLTWKLEQIK